MKYLLMLVYNVDSIREGVVVFLECTLLGFVAGIAWIISEWHGRWESRHLPGLTLLKQQPRELPCKYFDPTDYVGFCSPWQVRRC